MKQTRLGPAWWLLAVGTIAALGFAWLDSLRAGGYAVAAVLVIAAALRLGPESLTDGLAVRSRLTDVITLLVMALAVAVIFAIVKL